MLRFIVLLFLLLFVKSYGAVAIAAMQQNQEDSDYEENPSYKWLNNIPSQEQYQYQQKIVQQPQYPQYQNQYQQVQNQQQLYPNPQNPQFQQFGNVDDANIGNPSQYANGQYSQYQSYQQPIQQKQMNSYISSLEGNMGHTNTDGSKPTLGLEIGHFIQGFIESAKQMGVSFVVTTPPHRRPTGQRETALFCMGNKSLCFNAIWDIGYSRMESIIMVYAGDGTRESAEHLVVAAHSMINVITPGLSYSQRDKILSRMGIYTGADAGNVFVEGREGVGVEYSYAHANASGIMLVAIARG